LRERCEDIPNLVEHFVRKFSLRLNKPIHTIPDEVLEFLKLYDWPGNIRELQNVIERAVVLSPGTVLRPALAELRNVGKQESTTSARTLAAAERDHILEVLEQTKWCIGGQNGAAARLGLPRTSLIHKMRKLGIEARRSHRRSSFLAEPSFAVDAPSTAFAAAS
jgi:formate hydrogenlyase transcriptional activator